MKPRVLSPLAIVLVSAALAAAQAISEWRTPDGTLYFGESPPAGSTRIGAVGFPETSATANAGDDPAAGDDRFSVRASLERLTIERQMKAAAEDLEQVRSELGRLKRLLKTKNSGKRHARRGGHGSAHGPGTHDPEKRLRELQAKEKADLDEIAALRTELGELASEVRRHYGDAPPWWRDAVACPKCPPDGVRKSRSERKTPASDRRHGLHRKGERLASE